MLDTSITELDNSDIYCVVSSHVSIHFTSPHESKLRSSIHTGGMGPMRPGWGPIPMPAGGPIMGGHSG